jgi:hypothetical protein
MKRGAFALVDKEDAPSKAKRNSSAGLISFVQRKQRTAHRSSMQSTKQNSLAAASYLVYKHQTWASAAIAVRSFDPNMPRHPLAAPMLGPQRECFGIPNR